MMMMKKISLKALQYGKSAGMYVHTTILCTSLGACLVAKLACCDGGAR